ncbi:integral membrane protein [Sphingobacterium sp. Ag1]|uniref:integral membrane protein n=1 Tax=Sphingobacterium sp. Ag1 TaxID=1643451 RepID=UPI00062818F4|nr:integral membrane protein [Sphingobacterium sp. Ag1]KKO89641.1 integral membrane protein [Sphingobacterium sp. Ag1]
MTLDRTIWDDFRGKKLLLSAMSLALLTHGIIIYYTLPQTYDAFVHIFFADHYSRFWFEPWDYRWYTGFPTISYPPLVHQLIALISKIFPLKVAFCIYAILILEILMVGVYRFSKLFFDKTTAGVAALLTVVLSSIAETLHVFGQMPTLTGLAFLLNALPFLYMYLVKSRPIFLIMSLGFFAVVISSHHVTAIFGMVFFVAPTVFMALTDILPAKKSKTNFFYFIINIAQAALKKYKSLILFGACILILAIGLIFPYWYWSKTDPITQVSIPHGSRDNFFKKTSSGLVFYIIPLTLIFAFLPAITYSLLRNKRFLGWLVSFFLCLLLGSGGTTPLPKMILGKNAFEILTLDRFGFWASIIAIPFVARYIYSFMIGRSRLWWIDRFGSSTHFVLAGITGFTYFLFLIFIFHLASFRPLQPQTIAIDPIKNFLNRDEHMRWRYLTLGFGDQMAWLSANSLAATVDGNYHSARRLPELTSRPVERLENAKFSGGFGIASLEDFLTEAPKYSLKYIFCNDRYYDPLLYYTGWNRTIRLENGIMVWEKGNIPTIKMTPHKELSKKLKYMWGTVPICSLIITFILTLRYLRKHKEANYFVLKTETADYYPNSIIFITAVLPFSFFSFYMIKQVSELLFVNEQGTPEATVLNYYNHLDFQQFEAAHRLFLPSPTYSLDQYLLEKSVNDGGLLPSYAKLDSISIEREHATSDRGKYNVNTRWMTSLGYQYKSEKLHVVKKDRNWYIEPRPARLTISETQLYEHNYLLFKKAGKRLITSFPSIREDRMAKPLVNVNQINVIKSSQKTFLTGELMNIDDVPANVSLKLTVKYNNGIEKIYFPKELFQYNLAPKASSPFQIDLEKNKSMDSLVLQSVVLNVETDVSEKGYIHGGELSYEVKEIDSNNIELETRYQNNLTTPLTIPGFLVVEKDKNGLIWQTQLITHPTALRSGNEVFISTNIRKLQHMAKKIDVKVISVHINGKQQINLLPQIATNYRINKGIQAIPHSFIAEEFYLQ